MSSDRYPAIKQPIPETAYLPRNDDRDPGDQLHGSRRPDGTPDPDGNLHLGVRVGDLIDWLSDLPDDMPVCVECDGLGPENAESLVAETLTACDDPDPYDVVVLRPPHRPGAGFVYLRAHEAALIRDTLVSLADGLSGSEQLDDRHGSLGQARVRHLADRIGRLR